MLVVIGSSIFSNTFSIAFISDPRSFIEDPYSFTFPNIAVCRSSNLFSTLRSSCLIASVSLLISDFQVGMSPTLEMSSFHFSSMTSSTSACISS